MKSFFLLPFCCIVVIVMLSNCSNNSKENLQPCIHHERAKLTFTQGDRSIIPYSGNETLIFKNTSGDSIVFEKGSRNIGFNVEYQYTLHEAQEHNNCTGDYITVEKDQTDFYASVGKAHLQFFFTNSYTFDYPESIKYFLLSFVPDTVEMNFTAFYKFSNDTLFPYPDKNHDSIVNFHNQLTIGPKTFLNVYELYAKQIPPHAAEWYIRAYYSTIDGLVGLRTNFGRLLYLDRKR